MGGYWDDIVELLYDVYCKGCSSCSATSTLTGLYILTDSCLFFHMKQAPNVDIPRINIMATPATTAT